jgi:hypothetical protein
LIYRTLFDYFDFGCRSLREQPIRGFSTFRASISPESNRRCADSHPKMMLRMTGEESCHFSDDIAVPTTALRSVERERRTIHRSPQSVVADRACCRAIPNRWRRMHESPCFAGSECFFNFAR